MPDTIDIPTLAAQALEGFELSYRDNGDVYRRLADHAPDWIGNLVYAAHDDGQFLPDDWRYDTIVAALEYMSEPACDFDAEEFADSQVDTYYRSQLDWIAAAPSQRADYCAEEFNESGASDLSSPVWDLLGLGQYREARTVFETIEAFLSDHIDALEAEETAR